MTKIYKGKIKIDIGGGEIKHFNGNYIIHRVMYSGLKFPYYLIKMACFGGGLSGIFILKNRVFVCAD
jgi:hypothetical protein